MGLSNKLKLSDSNIVDLQKSKIDTGTLGKAMEVLEIISKSNKPMRFTQILEQTVQPRGTLHRQLSNLVEEGLLTSHPDHTYSLGVSLLKYASKAWSNNEFRLIANPHIQALHNETGETVHLGILKSDQIIYLDKVEGQQSVRMYSQIGNASPLYCTGVGKAALSALADIDVEELFRGKPFEKYTATTITSIRALKKELKEIRETGLAWDCEEHEVGIHCVAAPVISENKSIASGISVTGPVFRVSKQDLEKWAPLVQKTANAIMKDMAVKLSPRI